MTEAWEKERTGKNKEKRKKNCEVLWKYYEKVLWKSIMKKYYEKVLRKSIMKKYYEKVLWSVEKERIWRFR